MKIRKLSYLFILTLLIQLLPSGVLAENDVDGTKYEAPVKFFHDLGMIEEYTDGLYRTNLTISRGEFAILVADILQYDKEKRDAINVFEDVKGKDAAYQAVSYLSKRGIVKGDNVGNFRPGDIITSIDAEVMLVRMLGYEMMADLEGGYPSGYENVAVSLGLNMSYTKELSWGDALNLLYKAVEVELFSSKFEGDGTIEYSNHGKTILEEVMGLQKSMGLVVANDRISISGERCSSSRINIDYKTYSTALKNTDNLIGMNAYYYVDSDDNVISIIKKKYETVDIKSKDVLEGASLSEISYYNKNERKENAKISASAFYVHNGVPVKNPGDDFFYPDYGKIELIDNNNDSKFDVCFVWDYKSYAVDSVNTATKKVTCKDGTEFEIDEDKCDIFVIDRIGKRLSTEGIAADNTITVAEEAGILTIFVSDTVVLGKIAKEDRVEKTILVDGVEYGYLDAVDNSIKGGEVNQYFVDINNNVVWIVSKNLDGSLYGYMYKIFMDEENEQLAYLKLLTTESVVKNVKTTEKVKYGEGVAGKRIDASVLCSLLSNKPQLIKYRTNNIGEITEVITATESADYDETVFSKNIVIDKPAYLFETHQRWYCTPDGNEGVAYASDAKMFMLNADESKSKYASLTSLQRRVPYNKTEIYDINRYGLGTMFVIHNTAGAEESVATENPTMIVESVENVINEQDEVCTKITGWSKGAQVTYLAEEGLKDTSGAYGYKNVKVDSLKCGDVILAKASNEGALLAFSLVFRGDDKNEMFQKSLAGTDMTNTTYESVMCYAEVLGAADGFMLVSINGMKRNIVAESRIQTVRMDKSRKLEKITLTDIKKGDKVFIWYSRADFTTCSILVIQ